MVVLHGSKSATSSSITGSDIGYGEKPTVAYVGLTEASLVVVAAT